jgi:hypothetical protein
MHPERPGAYAVVAVPKGFSAQMSADIFREELRRHGLVGFLGPTASAGYTTTLDDHVPRHDRDAQQGCYLYPIIPHISEESGELILAKTFDSSMTLPEACWYNTYLLHTLGKRYVDIMWSDYHVCEGSGYSSRYSKSAIPTLEWDTQDIKVCLKR